jgi:hypothetical protein
MESGIVSPAIEAGDFCEGVRAHLIDKNRPPPGAIDARRGSAKHWSIRVRGQGEKKRDAEKLHDEISAQVHGRFHFFADDRAKACGLDCLKVGTGSLL